MRAGARVVMALKPTGLNTNSPIVCRKYVAVSHIGLTRAPWSAMRAGMIRMRKPAPTKIRPNPNLVGLIGSLPVDASLTHSHASTGANAKMNNEFIDWNQLLGYAMPNTSLRVLRSANRLRVEPACSNTDQNNDAAKNSTVIT